MIDRYNQLNISNQDLEESLIEETSQVMNKIFTIFDECKKNVQKIEKNLDILEALKEAQIKSVQRETNKVISLSMKKIVKNNLDFIEKNKKLLEIVQVIKNTETNSLTKDDYELIEFNYNNLLKINTEILQDVVAKESNFKGDMKEKMKRQLRAIDENITQQQLDEIAEDNDKIVNVLEQKLLGAPHIGVLNHLEDIKQKYDDIIVLEQNMRTINQIIDWMQQITHENFQSVKRVQDKVIKTKKEAQEGVKNLQQAKENEKETFKNRCKLIGVILLIIIIFFGPIMMSIMSARGYF